MGVTIYYETTRGKRVDITPGWRSMLWKMLIDNGLTGCVGLEDVPVIKELAKKQNRGDADPPFDWSLEIAGKLYLLAEAIQKHKTVTVKGEY